MANHSLRSGAVNPDSCVVAACGRDMLACGLVGGLAAARRGWLMPAVARRMSSGVTLSEAAAKRIQLVEPETLSLRLGVEGGGCSGMNYVFSLDDTAVDAKKDAVFEKGGVKLVVDKLSLPFLEGATVDYEESMVSAAFQVSPVCPRIFEIGGGGDGDGGRRTLQGVFLSRKPRRPRAHHGSPQPAV